mmetsp:Transcript_32602/g.70545  ORF Transcript_32602/g.70545 Transcript_32602/m.70545 type:complete len:109 (-) Transcript_32602:90-416(-)
MPPAPPPPPEAVPAAAAARAAPGGPGGAGGGPPPPLPPPPIIFFFVLLIAAFLPSIFSFGQKKNQLQKFIVPFSVGLKVCRAVVGPAGQNASVAYARLRTAVIQLHYR